MKRTIIKIDEELCNGCGECVTGCHEGALQLIDGKARMISDLFCDGLGACIGECPVGAIELIEREAEAYDEIAVMERISPKGTSTVLAHLNHLKDHNEMVYFNQGLEYIKQNNLNIDLSTLAINKMNTEHQHKGCGCPGSQEMDFSKPKQNCATVALNEEVPSQLSQWPVQLHLLNPMAGYFKNANVVLAADCVAFSFGNFHNHFLKGKTLAIACPKLDSGKESYIEKLSAMIDESKINTLSVIMMEVPCCGGLLQIAKMAVQASARKIPIKAVVVSIQGEIISEDWV
ncbi:MAG: 4Fe-4S binding protein [Bacteroidetes bacterium]|nr:4Fe-4S binding protein [Bacteroidota bacterium]